MKLFILSLVLIAFVISCSTSSDTTYVNENYPWKQNTPKELVIFPIPYNSFDVLNWDDVVDDFEVDSANSKSFIYDTLSKALLINSKSCTRYLTIVDGKDFFNLDSMNNNENKHYEITKLLDGKFKMTFLVPNKEFLPTQHSDSYALIINYMIISRNIDQTLETLTYMPTPEQTANTPGGTVQIPSSVPPRPIWTPENLGATTEYIIWDYEKNDFVKCGLVTSKEDLLGGMTTGSWLDLFKTIPLELYEDTPFGISPVNYYYKK
jgi:hypothetical protein